MLSLNNLGVRIKPILLPYLESELNICIYSTIVLFFSEAAWLPKFTISYFHLFYKEFLSTMYSFTLTALIDHCWVKKRWNIFINR